MSARSHQGTTAETLAALSFHSGRYGRSGVDRIGELIVATDALQAALQTLRTTPTPEGAEAVCQRLLDMHQGARQTMEVLLRETGHGG